jgi:hypothetical protein
VGQVGQGLALVGELLEGGEGHLVPEGLPQFLEPGGGRLRMTGAICCHRACIVRG